MAKARIVLSGSQQPANQYAGGGTGVTDSEQHWCGQIVDVAAADLRARGHEVLVPREGSYTANVVAGNAFTGRYGIYLAVHSNAHDTRARGTLTLFRAGSNDGRMLAEAVHARVAPVSSAADPGVKGTTELGELNRPIAKYVAMVEIDFHDNLQSADEIRAKVNEYGHAIAAGILDFLGEGDTDMKPLVLDIVPGGMVPLYRFIHQQRGDVVLASTQGGCQAAVDAGYEYAGVIPLSAGNTIPLYQHVSRDGFHFYTTNTSEPGFTNQGEVAKVAEVGDGATVYRALKGAGHLYGHVEGEARDQGWEPEGATFGSGTAKGLDPVIAAKAAHLDLIAPAIEGIAATIAEVYR